ncbi:MAG: hypothetical protein H7Z13_19730 [Ferruginibacter sp.]|nr:hypothetical protein [Ferruginibacter sp.]
MFGKATQDDIRIHSSLNRHFLRGKDKIKSFFNKDFRIKRKHRENHNKLHRLGFFEEIGLSNEPQDRLLVNLVNLEQALEGINVQIQYFLTKNWTPKDLA